MTLVIQKKDTLSSISNECCETNKQLTDQFQTFEEIKQTVQNCCCVLQFSVLIPLMARLCFIKAVPPHIIINQHTDPRSTPAQSPQPSRHITHNLIYVGISSLLISHFDCSPYYCRNYYNYLNLPPHMMSLS